MNLNSRFTMPILCHRMLLSSAVIIAVTAIVSAQSSPEESQKDAAKTGAISGLIVNETDQPLANASVFLRTLNAPAQGRNVITDSEGRFQVTGLEPAIYYISASVPAYVSTPIDPESPSYYRVGDSVRLSLVKGGVVTGIVTSASGEPVVQVVVRAILIREGNGQLPKYWGYQSREFTTDDRGAYRIYGLRPGVYLIAAGGGLAFGNILNAYNTDAPTYAPGSTRDTAAEITVRAGEETGGVDIRYRNEPGHTVSGIVNGPPGLTSGSSSTITLSPVGKRTFTSNSTSFQVPGSRGFAFYGVADGEYDLIARLSVSPTETGASDPLRITVKGADITGIELTTKPLGSISGHVALESSTAPQCKGKRRVLFAETLITAERNEKDKDSARDQPGIPFFSSAQVSPDKAGDFAFRSLGAGQYRLNTAFSGRYWYLRSLSRQSPSTEQAARKTGPSNQPFELSRDWIPLKSGEQIKGLTISLAEGAAWLRGRININDNEALPPKTLVYLVPAEKEKAEDVFRFFVALVMPDGRFSLVNLPPGRYWILARGTPNSESPNLLKFRGPEEARTRATLRQDAENAKNLVELEPCQNVIDYQLPFSSPTVKSAL